MTNKSSVSCSLILAAIIALLKADVASSSDIPEFPKNRFTPWFRLNWIVQNDARFLLFTPQTWNALLTGPLERMSYEDVADFLGLNDAQKFAQWQKTNNALQSIAIDSRSWDCWINHYIGNDWDDLVFKHNVSWAFEELGWNRFNWKSTNPADWPESEQKMFSELSPAEVRAAERICCPAEIWNGYPLSEWEYNSGGFSTTQLNFEAKYPPSTSPPVAETEVDSTAPTAGPTGSPTTLSPTVAPTKAPTKQPSASPTATPTASPTKSPSAFPTTPPSFAPTVKQTSEPTTSEPTASPTKSPTKAPTSTPTVSPTAGATATLSNKSPTVAPIVSPTIDPTKAPTVAPTKAPTKAPTVSPTVSPTTSAPSSSPIKLGCVANFTLILLTDKYPKETSWSLAETSSGQVVAESLGYLNDFEKHQDTMCIQYDHCYLFTIRDAWDDGICCENGQGSYAGFIEYPESDGVLVAIPGLEGGAFETKARHMFCLDENGVLVEGEGLGDAIGVRFNGRDGGT